VRIKFFYSRVPVMFSTCSNTYSQCFSPGFLMSSPWCSSSSQIVPKGVPNNTSFYFIFLAQRSFFLTYVDEPKGEVLYPDIETIIWGSLPCFPSGSHYVPQVPNVFSHMFSITPHFYPICFGKCSPLFTYIGGPKERNSIFQNKTFYSGEPPYLFIFQWWANQIGSLQKHKIWTWEAPHLVNRRGK